MKSASSAEKILTGVAVLAGLMFLVAITKRDASLTTWEFVVHMNDSPALKAQKLDEHGYGMRVPPAGTIAQNQPPLYRYTNDPEGSSKNPNPLARDRATLKRGQAAYATYCAVCHGPKGEGNGSIVPKFPMPPTLHSDKVKGWTDGRIYHVITMGQNLMPSYASQLLPEDRWAIIHYIRVLQRALAPTEADLEAYKASKAGN